MSKYIENCHELVEMSGGKIDEAAALAIGSFMAETENLCERIRRAQVLSISQRYSTIAALLPLVVESMLQAPNGEILTGMALLKCTERLLAAQEKGKTA